MTPEEQFQRNLDHARDLLGHLLRNPAELDGIPEGAHIVAMPTDDPELCEANEAMLRRVRERAGDGVSAHGRVRGSTLLVNV